MSKRQQEKRHRKELARKEKRQAKRLHNQAKFSRESYIERVMRTGKF